MSVRLLSKVIVEVFPRLDRVPVDCGISIVEFLQDEDSDEDIEL